MQKTGPRPWQRAKLPDQTHHFAFIFRTAAWISPRSSSPTLSAELCWERKSVHFTRRPSSLDVHDLIRRSQLRAAGPVHTHNTRRQTDTACSYLNSRPNDAHLTCCACHVDYVHCGRVFCHLPSSTNKRITWKVDQLAACQHEWFALKS